ncbi:kxDL motif-containing protein LO9-177 isoform X2 [Elaeis guineensis]|uniref:KxDL motif-containing protein 1 isoform X2 n=1 Tax=Elaeis guineensis var. tenera TaxID=51953 RepID=A0A6I9RCJ7_ELAGV|nr:kxDL motif-containing protein 1 isoform X2 [Elaeis guineensis]
MVPSPLIISFGPSESSTTLLGSASLNLLLSLIPQRRLGRLQDSNAVLAHFNEYSERCYAEVSGDFSRNTQLLKSIKSDLDHIFTKLRSMKAKLKATYPDAFPDGSATDRLDQRPDLEMPLQ